MPHDGWHPHDHSDDDEPHAHRHHHHHHGPPTRRAVLAAAALLPFGTASARRSTPRSASPRRPIAFSPPSTRAQRLRALIAFESDNRIDWHYIPRNRSGLSLGEMQPAQAAAARALFATVLNDGGLKLLDGVRLLEGVLREQQGSFRDPARYYVSVFGTPGRFPWGWRFEGHHLSLNVTLPAAGHVAVTPFFVGAHPATVRDGPNRGFRLLGTSEDLARQIMAGLTAQQRQTAIIADRSFGEIVASRSASATSASRAASTSARWAARSAPSSRR